MQGVEDSFEFSAVWPLANVVIIAKADNFASKELVFKFTMFYGLDGIGLKRK
jgi:hypothetical protein